MASLFSIRGEQRYEVVRKIFEGGMGIVYEAEQHGARNFLKRVAIKVIRQNFATQKEFIENFIGEAKLVADLIHTNIVQTYQLGELNGIYYIAMEYINGVNLEQFMQQVADKKKKLPVELAVFIASRVCRGLAYAHAKTDKHGKPLGIVHRDVSFKNVMVAFEGGGFSHGQGRRSDRGQGRLHESRAGGFSDYGQALGPVLRRHRARASAPRAQHLQRRERRRVTRPRPHDGDSGFPQTRQTHR